MINLDQVMEIHLGEWEETLSDDNTALVEVRTSLDLKIYSLDLGEWDKDEGEVLNLISEICSETREKQENKKSIQKKKNPIWMSQKR